MNQKINQHIAYLMKEKGVNLIISQAKDSNGFVIPHFILSENDIISSVIAINEMRNFFAYLNKQEIKSFKSIGIVCNYFGVKTFFQLKFENQLKDLELFLLIPTDDDFIEITSEKQAEDYLSGLKQSTILVDEELENVKKMSMEERWNYWMKTLELCTKCYACRAACPMCYCSSCTTECNIPQWIPVPASLHGIFEWHVMRAMHLAGRCIECDGCVKVCPANIPLNILNKGLHNKISEAFSSDDSSIKYALNFFQPDEKVDFIK